MRDLYPPLTDVPAGPPQIESERFGIEAFLLISITALAVLGFSFVAVLLTLG